MEGGVAFIGGGPSCMNCIACSVNSLFSIVYGRDGLYGALLLLVARLSVRRYHCISLLGSDLVDRVGLPVSRIFLLAHFKTILMYAAWRNRN